MSLLEKLGLPSRSADTAAPAPAAKPPTPGTQPTALPKKKIVVPPPDATDGRRTRLDLDDDEPTPVAGPAPGTGTTAPKAAADTETAPTTADDDTVTITDDPDTPATTSADGKPADAPDADADAQAEPKKMRVDIVNRSGFQMIRHSFGTEDSEHVAYDAEPALKMADKGFTSIVARTKGEDATGPAGDVLYRVLDPQGEVLVSMTWRHGASPVGKATPNDGRFIVEPLRKGDDKFQYVVLPALGKPAADPLQPMKIRIENFSGTTLFLDKFGLDNPKSQFNPEPPATLDGGGKRFTFTVFSLDAEFPKVSGFADYRFSVEPPRDDNPSGQYRMSIGWAEDGVQMGQITPEGKNMEIEFGGDDRNPVFSFFGADPEFKPPGKASEPTLRKGDKSPDGWVEYLQELLNLKGAKLDVDGDFGGETLKAVKAFQRKHKKEGVLEDGVVGDETWSFLREGAPAKPKTDGRKPHTFVEKGNSARWTLESRQPIYDEGEDTAIMNAVSVGDVDQIAKRNVRFRVISPSGEAKVFDRPIGDPFESSKTGQGNRHNIAIKDFSELFGTPPVPKKPPPGDYKFTAFFPADLGGDTFEGVLNIPAP